MCKCSHRLVGMNKYFPATPDLYNLEIDFYPVQFLSLRSNICSHRAYTDQMIRNLELNSSLQGLYLCWLFFFLEKKFLSVYYSLDRSNSSHVQQLSSSIRQIVSPFIPRKKRQKYFIFTKIFTTGKMIRPKVTSQTD